MKKIIVTLIILVIIIIIGVFAFSHKSAAPTTTDQTVGTIATTTETQATATTTQNSSGEEVIGKSVEGNDILAYHYGTGSTELMFVAGLHGGYEWNTTLLAYQLMDYLQANPSVIPANVQVTIIPVVNPDGLNDVVGTTSRFTASDVSTSQSVVVAGRFNANDVDLNRNFDCDWQATGTWQNKSVSGGTAAFSEPETQAIKNYVEAHNPAAVVAWFSAAGGVYGSSCDGTTPAQTATLTTTYATASGYPAYKTFTAYETSGDMTNWLAKMNIPAISVLLTNHTDTEWTKNQAGVLAILKSLAK